MDHTLEIAVIIGNRFTWTISGGPSSFASTHFVR